MPDPRDSPLAGRLIVDDDGRRVQCHICGRWYVKLGIHLSKGHHLTPDQYREQFGLNRQTRLSSPEFVTRLATANRTRLDRIRPPINLVTSTPAYHRAPSRPPRRLESRLEIGAMQKAHQREHPQPKKLKADPRPTRPGLAQGPRRAAELHRDPAWRREWLLKVRPRSVLSDEQILEARALVHRHGDLEGFRIASPHVAWLRTTLQNQRGGVLVGDVSQAELAARWGVSVWTVGKAQRGKLKTLAELLIDLDRDQPRS